MVNAEQQYLLALRKFCEEVRLDYFPQVEASELLYKVITLEDIYLPLTLGEYEGNYRKEFGLSSKPTKEDMDRFISFVDEKLTRLESSDLFEKEPKKVDNVSEKPEDAALRLVLRAGPGAGKTTFCKRMILAYLNQDMSFFNKYLQENELCFHTNRFPVLLNCKNILNLSVSNILQMPFPTLIYTLCNLGMPPHFSELSESAFRQLFLEKTESGLFLVLDGWDEILNAEKADAFTQRLNEYLSENPHTDFMLTIRNDYFEPQLEQDFLFMHIKPLTPDDIRTFCQRWCDIILSRSPKEDSHRLIAEQIISSTDQQIMEMRKNALDLSLLLIVCKNDGRLPDNKADLFKDLLDLYIFWSTHKNTGILSQKSIRVFLAYIAAYFTKHDILLCDFDRLLLIVEQCVRDLEWTFSEDLSQTDVRLIIKELSHTGILTCTFDGKTFTFAGAKGSTHRQMQEYLAAYAILVQYADEEYNSMSPVEIFEDKYDKPHWREIILFISLMDNARVRHEIVRRLIAKAQENEDDNYYYTNLLFELVVNGADIRMAEKNKIFDIVFREHITDQQILNIIKLAGSDTRVSTEFFGYISDKFSQSVAAGEQDYAYAKAIGEAALALKQNTSPFVLAEQLLASGDDPGNIIVAARIVALMSWCKYVDIKSDFSRYFSHYRMSSKFVGVIKNHLKKDHKKKELMKSIREAMLAEFVPFDVFFSTRDLNRYYAELETAEDPEAAEIVLSMAPVFDLSFRNGKSTTPEIREKYILRMAEEIGKKDYDSVIFTFAICVALGCWVGEALTEKWASMEKIYSGPQVSKSSMGKTRFLELKRYRDEEENFLTSVQEITGFLVSEEQRGNNSWLWKEMSQKEQRHEDNWFEQEMAKADINAITTALYSNGWKLVNFSGSQFVYEQGSRKMIVRCPEGHCSPIAARFLTSSIPAGTSGRNNLAYLLRRGEISSIEQVEQDLSSAVEVTDLLQEGIALGEPFSLMNGALAVSGTYINTIGDLEKGKAFLVHRLAEGSGHERTKQEWAPVFRWWFDLANDYHELEGIVAILWLYQVGVFDPEGYAADVLEKFVERASKVSEQDMKGICDFIDAVKKTLDQRQ